VTKGRSDKGLHAETFENSDFLGFTLQSFDPFDSIVFLCRLRGYMFWNISRTLLLLLFL